MPNETPRLNIVAGGAGFIGSHLCHALLARGEAVLCLDNMQTARPSNLDTLRDAAHFAFVRHDIVDPLPSAVTRHTRRIARVWNLACAASPPQYQRDPEHTMLTNVLGTDRLLQLAEAAGARFLLTSTSEVYGDPEQHPQAESYRGLVSCTGPRACYDEGKRAAETLAFDFARTGRAEVRVARLFNTYGPHMQADDGRVVSNLLSQVIAGEPVTLYGDGNQTRSFCYVADMVDGLLRLMDCDDLDAEPVNLGNPDERSMKELVEEVGRVSGRPPAVIHLPLPIDDPRRRRPDIGRAIERLGWRPTTPLTTGLTQTHAWFADMAGATTIEAPEAMAAE